MVFIYRDIFRGDLGIATLLSVLMHQHLVDEKVILVNVHWSTKFWAFSGVSVELSRCGHLISLYK